MLQPRLRLLSLPLIARVRSDSAARQVGAQRWIRRASRCPRRRGRSTCPRPAGDGFHVRGIRHGDPFGETAASHRDVPPGESPTVTRLARHRRRLGTVRFRQRLGPVKGFCTGGPGHVWSQASEQPRTVMGVEGLDVIGHQRWNRVADFLPHSAHPARWLPPEPQLDPLVGRAGPGQAAWLLAAWLPGWVGCIRCGGSRSASGHDRCRAGLRVLIMMRVSRMER